MAEQPFNPPPLQVFELEEAAAILRVGRTTLYEGVRAGRVPHRRILGTGVKFTADDLRQILEQGACPAAAPRRVRVA